MDKTDPRGEQTTIINYISCRIVRNRAAEKAKIHGYGSPNSPEVSPLTPGLTHDSHTALRQPSYSINGILGIHQQADANANVQKRKRDIDGRF